MTKPHERITTVKFLRTQAAGAGGIDTVKGRALHRAAAYVVRLHEEMDRCRIVTQSSDYAARRVAAAEGIYRTLRARSIVAGQAEPPEWYAVSDADREVWLEAADAALGLPPHHEGSE